ncbi:hypothetical protein JW879_10330 [candidate division WOR-3 bacterium]|nr:hypothetical protein [candidate division WOR-3 bacterium]
MKVKAVNRSNKNFVGIILIIICLLGCEPKLLVVPDFPDPCEKRSDFSDIELFISKFKMLDLPDVYNYNAEDYIEMEEMFIEYIKSRNTFKEIHPSFLEKEKPKNSYLTMDVEIIPDLSFKTNSTLLDACIFGCTMGSIPGVSLTQLNTKVKTIVQIRDSKREKLKELKAEALTSDSSPLYDFAGLAGEEKKTRKMEELFEKSYGKSFNLISLYISEARTELIDTTISVDTVKLRDEQTPEEESDEKTGKTIRESEAHAELIDTITTDTSKSDDNKTYMEELNRKLGKRNGRRDAEKDFNPALWIFNGAGTACVSLGAGMIVDLTNYYSSGEEISEMTDYYFYSCLGMGLLGVIQSYLKNPPPPDPSVFVGKSPEYIESYTNEYRKASKESQTGAFALSYIITHGVSIMSLFIYSEASTTPGY